MSPALERLRLVVLETVGWFVGGYCDCASQTENLIAAYNGGNCSGVIGAEMGRFFLLVTESNCNVVLSNESNKDLGAKKVVLRTKLLLGNRRQTGLRTQNCQLFLIFNQ